MWRFFALAVLAAALQIGCLTAAARAQDSDIECDAFVKNADGSWTVIRKTFIPVQNVRVMEGTIFRPGGTFLGDDMTVRLGKACPGVTAAPPPGAAASGASQPPQVLLSRYGDANGNIDVQRLSCGHLADASPEEADLLLAWYSGWYNGVARKRGINLARVRYAMRNVADYCKGNRDKRLSEVMELMLK